MCSGKIEFTTAPLGILTLTAGAGQNKGACRATQGRQTVIEACYVEDSFTKERSQAPFIAYSNADLDDNLGIGFSIVTGPSSPAESQLVVYPDCGLHTGTRSPTPYRASR